MAAALALAGIIGVPLLVKAVGGGGGRGMKRVDRLQDLPAPLELAAAEAGAAFGDARVYLERYVTRGRHVEVQVLGDGMGRVIHLGERDCSAQRRYQKLIEETPAPGLSADFARDSCRRGALCGALGYRGAGTVEFLVHDRHAFYFLEMNARIQVEHPVTEAVTGIDLIAEQIAIAAGAGLRLEQSDMRRQGCAIECRINAEDPSTTSDQARGSCGGVAGGGGNPRRYPHPLGSRITPYYDSLMAKIIAHAADRPAALARLRRAIAATRIDGVASNLEFHADVLEDPEFQKGVSIPDSYRLSRTARGGRGSDRTWLIFNWWKPRCATATSACGRRWDRHGQNAQHRLDDGPRRFQGHRFHHLDAYGRRGALQKGGPVGAHPADGGRHAQYAPAVHVHRLSFHLLGNRQP